jgi:hypothetical protein
VAGSNRSGFDLLMPSDDWPVTISTKVKWTPLRSAAGRAFTVSTALPMAAFRAPAHPRIDFDVLVSMP